jgi:2-dehydropantoate 2-reductase
MRLLVIGAGATGGYFGGRLAQAGRDVTFLVRPRRAAQLRETGLVIASPDGEVRLAPRLILCAQITAPFDVVLLSVKAHALATAIEDFAPAVGPDTMIVPVLNGMRHLEVLTRRFGERAVLGGVCKIVAELGPQGQVMQRQAVHELLYGLRDGSLSERLTRLDGFMHGAGFDARLSTQIMQDMWEKWVLLAGIGGLTGLLRGDLKEIAAAPGGADLARSFLKEVTEVAAASGHPAPPPLMAYCEKVLTGRSSITDSSLYRDLSAGNPIEAEQIVGDMAERAQRAGIPTPLLAASRSSLAIYQQKLADSRRPPGG